MHPLRRQTSGILDQSLLCKNKDKDILKKESRPANLVQLTLQKGLLLTNTKWRSNSLSALPLRNNKNKNKNNNINHKEKLGKAKGINNS